MGLHAWAGCALTEGWGDSPESWQGGEGCCKLPLLETVFRVGLRPSRLRDMGSVSSVRPPGGQARCARDLRRELGAHAPTEAAGPSHMQESPEPGPDCAADCGLGARNLRGVHGYRLAQR